MEQVVRVVARPQDTLCGILKGDAPFTDMVATAMGLDDALTAGFIGTKRAISTKHYGWGCAQATSVLRFDRLFSGAEGLSYTWVSVSGGAERASKGVKMKETALISQRPTSQ